MAQNSPNEPPASANLPQRRGEKGLETAAPTIEQNRRPSMSRFPEPIPVEQPGFGEQIFDALHSYVLSEETLVLVEFLFVIAIGVVAFYYAYPPIMRGVVNLHELLTTNFGIPK